MGKGFLFGKGGMGERGQLLLYPLPCPEGAFPLPNPEGAFPLPLKVSSYFG